MPINLESNIEGLAGVVGVGALGMLGLFLILDGRASGLFPTIEFYAKTATWGIVAAIPVLAIAYILGLLLIGVAQLLTTPICSIQSINEISDLITISQYNNDAIMQQYLQLRHDQEILGGSALAFVLLALGAMSEAHHLPHIRKVVYFSSASALLGAVAVFGLTILKINAAHSFATTMSVLQP